MLTSTTINGIALDASGRASKSGSNLRKLKLMTEANNIVEKISRPGMNKMQRLRASFDYVKKQYTYYCWREFRNTQDWEKDFAEDMFFRGGRGDCVSYAAAFAYLANAVGMKKVYVICSGGHGWAEIGGKVYDPDWALVSSVDSYFAMSYDLSGVNGRPMYRGNRLYVKKDLSILPKGFEIRHSILPQISNPFMIIKNNFKNLLCFLFITSSPGFQEIKLFRSFFILRIHSDIRHSFLLRCGKIQFFLISYNFIK